MQNSLDSTPASHNIPSRYTLAQTAVCPEDVVVALLQLGHYDFHNIVNSPVE